MTSVASSKPIVKVFFKKQSFFYNNTKKVFFLKYSYNCSLMFFTMFIIYNAIIRTHLLASFEMQFSIKARMT